MKRARRIVEGDVPPIQSDVEIAWRTDDDAASDRRFLEIVRRIRDKHRARLALEAAPKSGRR